MGSWGGGRGEAVCVERRYVGRRIDTFAECGWAVWVLLYIQGHSELCRNKSSLHFRSCIRVGLSFTLVGRLLQ